MIFFKSTSLIAILGLSISGCATHSLMRGSVVMKTTENSAHVCLGKDEVKVGDRLELYKNECKSIAGKIESQICKRVVGGYGEVTRTLNDHYSVVKFPEGTEFSEGDTVEKSTR